MTHALSCSIWGLFITRHNKIRDGLHYISRHAFTLESERGKPLIHQGNTRSEQEIRQGGDKEKETRGDVMVRVLWDCKVDTIIDVKLGDADADTYQYEPITALLARWENTKKDKHDKHCHNEQKHFSLFSLSVDGMLGREALVFLSQLSLLMEEKR